MKAWIWIVGIVVVLFLGVAVFWEGDEPVVKQPDVKKPDTKVVEPDVKKKPDTKPDPKKPRVISKITGKKGTAEILEGKWSTPVALDFGFEQPGWPDSPYITRDGSQIMLFWYPEPRLADPKVADEVNTFLVMNADEVIEKGWGGIYVSDRPFTSHDLHPTTKARKYSATRACPYIAKDGALWYCSTEESFVQQKAVPPAMYRDGKRIPLTTASPDEGNPDHCDAIDLLVFDCPGDERLCFMPDAKKNGFKGPSELASINQNREGSVDSIAFLTDDCKELYFTSNRKDDVLAIYKTERLDEKGLEWSEPTEFIKGKGGNFVAELSMTADKRELVFSQVSWLENGDPFMETYYSVKEE